MKVTITPHSRNIINGLMIMNISIPEEGIVQEVNITPIKSFEIIPRPSVESLDFLYFSVYISIIDRLIKREWFADNWSRNIEVEIPVSNPKKWEESRDKFEKALNFLSGDNWSLIFVNLEENYFQIDELPLLENNKRYKHVCLFSGGLDSLIGAIDLAQNEDNIILSSFYDGHGAISDKQNKLFREIKGSKNIFLNQFALKSFYSNENTTRVRSILFLGLAIFTAINLDIPTITTPENGLIAINIPLTSSRAGSNSTRTMHPYFISCLQQALISLGHNIKIDNPYIFMTKGEMLLSCDNKTLLNTLIKETMSCSHPSIRQYWCRKDVKHCGYCMPCIIRRASIHKYDSSKDSGYDYGIDIFDKDEMRLDQDGIIPRNLKAVLYFLSLNPTEDKYKKLLRQVVKLDNQDKIIKMISHGYDEIRLLINDKGYQSIKEVIA